MYMQDFFEQSRPAKHTKAHYYGDVVRQLFLASGILILLTMPIYKQILPIDFIVITFFVVVLALAAGVTTPSQKWIIVVDTIISMIFLLTFQYFSFTYYAYDSFIIFLIRQLIAIIFLFSLYYSVKTLRAICLHQIEV